MVPWHKVTCGMSHVTLVQAWSLVLSGLTPSFSSGIAISSGLCEEAGRIVGGNPARLPGSVINQSLWRCAKTNPFYHRAST